MSIPGLLAYAELDMMMTRTYIYIAFSAKLCTPHFADGQTQR
jgi:hypothetical protein